MVRPAGWFARRLQWRIPLSVTGSTLVLFLIVRALGIDLARVPESPDPRPGWLPFVGVGIWNTGGELAWKRAYNGWESVGSPSRPTIDTNFLGGPIAIAGSVYDGGLGTYPSSEIEFDLGAEYSVLEVAVGIDDASPAGAGAFFSVAIDGSTVYASPGMRRGRAAERLSIPLTGARSLILVTAKDPAARVIGLTDWADLRLFRTLLPMAGAPPPVALGATRLRSILGASDRRVGRAEQDMLITIARQERDYVAERVEGRPGIATSADADRQRFILANQHVALIYEAAGDEPHSFTILDLREPRVLLYRSSLRITVDETHDIFIGKDAVIEEDNVRFRAVEEPGFGRGQSLDVRLRTRTDGGVILLRLALFQDVRHFLAQADLASASRTQRIDYAFFQRLPGPPLVLGTHAAVLADFSHPRQLALRDDGLIRSLVIDMGKPAVLWGDDTGGSIVLASMDETRRVPHLNLAIPPESRRALVSFVVSSVPNATTSPRVHLEFNPSPDLRTATGTYKRIFATLYPPARLPPWVRFQWLSWYPFGMDISSQVIMRQVDLIARHFLDLGAWHVIIDAGWYVAEGRPNADMRSIDLQKFPGGMRRLIDEIHARGLKAVVFINTPMISAQQRKDDWIGMRATIEQHPEWLIPIGRRSEPGTYILNYAHPGLRAHMHSLIEDIFQRYDADGMKIDGLGGGEGLSIRRGQRDSFGLVSAAVNQTVEIVRFTVESALRLKPDLYFEGGWHNPGFAQPYAHTFRYGDDAPGFNSPYPVDGLVEHIDYAAYMKVILGQRPNMGALNHNVGGDPHNLAWLQAAIALDAQAELSFDLSTLHDPEVAAYRAILNHYRPFSGETSIDRVLEPSVFVTRDSDFTYIGLLNRSSSEQTHSVRLSDYGLSSPGPQTIFDVSAQKAKTISGSLEESLPPQSFRLFLLTRGPRVVWTSSKYVEARTERRLEVELSGPSHVPGFASAVLPRTPSRVLMDAAPLVPVQGTPQPGQYALGDGHLLTVTYTHAQPHRLEVEF